MCQENKHVNITGNIAAMQPNHNALFLNGAIAQVTHRVHTDLLQSQVGTDKCKYYCLEHM